MAGKHSRKEKSKAPVIIVVVIAVLLIAAAAVFFIFFNPFNSTPQPETPTEAPAATQVVITQAADETVPPTAAPEPEVEEETGFTHEEATIEIELPGGEEGASYFNASYIPNGKVIDTYTGGETNLREVFGRNYSEGVITFNSDGTFTDTLGSSSVDSGKYAVKDGVITATYTDDKNMQIEVFEWNGDAPSSFCINYGGYEVYFG